MHHQPVRRRIARLGLATLTLGALLAGQIVTPQKAHAVASPSPVTFEGPLYQSGGDNPSADKPQSKLWHNDGFWWGLLRTSDGVTVHRLVDHEWLDTGTVVDERLSSTGDALWDGNKLFVATRVSNGPSRVVRFSYDAGEDRYTKDVSQQVGANATESITIDKDSTGKLWVSYTQGGRVYVAHSTSGDAAWTAPFLLPVSDNTVDGDDISAVIAFGGKIGVMYSDQEDAKMWFAVHEDKAAVDTWTLEAALTGSAAADDHINLKSLLEDDAGKIYAAIKTSRTDSSGPSIMVLQRTAIGSWSGATAARVQDGLTRPQIALDRSGRRLLVLMADEGGGPTVYYKTTSLGTLSFGTGRGDAFVTWGGSQMNDPSTTKQAVDSTTGLVVLSSDDKSSTKRYYHAELELTAPK